MKPWKEVIDGIRNAVLGKEVREDMAQMGEYVEQFANTAGENIQKAIDPTLSLSGKAADAAKVGEAVNAETTRAKAAEEENAKGVSQLKEDLGKLATFGKNLFDKNKAVIGYALDDNGELTNDSSVFAHATEYLTSDFIPCFKYVGMYFCIAPENGAIYFYDENKRFISKVSNILYSHGRKIINSAYYFRFITAKSTLDTVTARVFETMPMEAPVYDDYGIKINDDVNIKSDGSKLDKNQGTDNSDKYMKVDNDGNLVPSDPPVDDRLFIGGTVTNAGQQEETISIGVNAGRNTQNGYIAIGHGAMGKAIESNTDNDNGKYSTAIGHRALGENTTGDHNTAVGWGCMGGNTTGNGNTAIGEDALCHGNGDSNTCVGNRAYQRGQGSRNVVIGVSAMYTSDNSVELPSGYENVSVGNSSGCPSGNGSRNTCIGHEAKTSEGVEASIAIGYRSRARKSQQVVLGNTTTYKKTIETVLVGDIVVMGIDNIFRKLSFNEDGSISWTDVSTDYADYLIN